ncbi:MAG: Cold-shock DNA-binding domain-containing protein [uncultured Sulfurovum sp.]|uniref:Cold-shock DNA-binding domain-containing protein n=1 Tax=uncultured Sulfurovum sp. TaxID=269237 RepID=A0A6S6TRU9_9BACT|nr:MAG: Cold-shock DNA-binding domain-containing protein [uncultured Sulfurovum sp.]
MQGYIIHFNNEKGYGFIASDEQETNIFVHISQVQNTNELSQGQSVEFNIEKTPKGLSAVNVIAGKKHYSPYLIFGLLSFVILTLVLLYASQYVQLLVAYLIAINISTFLLYGYDKFISGTEKLRVPELNLQTLALLGGSPSALIVQKLFRHKTLKGSFQVIYWLIVMGQVGLLLWFTS